MDGESLKPSAAESTPLPPPAAAPPLTAAALRESLAAAIRDKAWPAVTVIQDMLTEAKRAEAEQERAAAVAAGKVLSLAARRGPQ